jgi:peptide subunit release factor 1 (eRF1)
VRNEPANCLQFEATVIKWNNREDREKGVYNMDMIQRVKNLSNIQKDYRLVSSLYLRLWPDSRLHRTKVKDLIREKAEQLNQGEFSGEEKRLIEDDFRRIQEYVESVSESSFRGVAVFASAADGLWEVFPLSLPVRDLFVLDYSPHPEPLLHALQAYKKVCTVLVERGRARIFDIFMGDIKEENDMDSDVPKTRDMGENSLNARQVERHIGEHVRTYLAKLADRLLIQFHQKGFDWLLIGGHPEFLPEVEGALHPSLRGMVKRTFRMGLNAGIRDVFEKSLEIMEEVKKEEDRSLVSRLENALSPDDLGVTGPDETLASLYEGAVRTLVIEERFSQEGACCPECQFMALQAGRCPMCRSPMIRVPDVVEEAVATALDRDSEVVYVGEDAGMKALGGIGALLRYKPVMEKRKEDRGVELDETAA